MNKISANVIVYNEEKNIRQCLESIKKVVDEIVVVHDGPCTDKTLEIAKKYTKRIYVRSYVGEAEPHRPFALKQSNYDWILVLDADEYLTEPLQKEIKNLIKNKDIDGYAFYWPFYYMGKLRTWGPISRMYRLSLFRKDKTTISGIPHGWYKVNGKVKNIHLTLEHKQPLDNWTVKGFKRKSIRWATVDAKYRIQAGHAKYPAIFYLIKSMVWPFIYFFLYIFWYNAWLNGWLGIKMVLFMSWYNFLLYFNIFKIKLGINL